MKKPASVSPNQQLKQARVLQGWSQEYVAQEVGTEAFTVSRWERGIAMPSPHFRLKLCTLFGMSALELGLVPQLAEHVSTPPSASPTQDLLVYIQPPTLDPTIPPLPAGEMGLVGRDELLRHLKQRLRSSKHAAVSALNGLPGAGKTALATTLAHDEEIQQHFSAGILWAGLGRQPDVLGVLSRWGTLLNSVPADLAQRSRPEAWAASIHAGIGQRRMLLVIDDAWDTANAQALRIGGSNCAHLVTTRFPEIARRFAAEGAFVVRELENTDGRLLLMRLAPAAVQTEPQEAQALVTAVGGLPLALTLLGHFLRGQAHSGQPRRIRTALERLRRADERLRLAEPQTLISSHPSLEAGTPLSLQAAIGISEQQISQNARATLRALAAFPPKPNTFSEEAAVEISAMPVDTLDELSDAGLLESCGPERYTLHQTIADYASLSPGASAEVDRRMVAYFVDCALQHTTDFATLDLESANILAALETASRLSMQEALIQGVLAFAPFLITRGLYAVAETLLQQALNATLASGEVSNQVEALLHLGRIAEQRCNYRQSQAIWQEALNLARQRGDSRRSAHVLRELGELARIQGQPQQALQLLTEALDILTLPEDRQIRAGILRMQANLLSEQGQPDAARPLYQQALSICQQIKDQRGMAFALTSLGVCAREQGQAEQAREFYEKALEIFRALGDQNSAGTVLMNLGNLARHQGQTAEANRLYTEALALSRQAENRRVATFVLLNLAILNNDQGKFEQARRILHEVIPTFRELQDRRNLALALQALGQVEYDEHKPASAREHLDGALALFRELHDRRQIGLTLRLLGSLARQEQRLPEALAILNEALALLEQVGDRREAAQTHIELGALARQEGRLDEARTLLLQALATTRQMRDRRYAARALSELGQLALQEGQPEEAMRALLGAGVGLRLVNSFELASTQDILAQVHAQLGATAFLACAGRLARSTPEQAYGLSQASWRAAIQQLSIPS
ncbi:MAG TPA: tetratricopeptide repeat protein [Ktedonobacteraceae bacterium]